MQKWLTNLVVALRLVTVVLAGLGAAGVINPAVPVAVGQALGTVPAGAAVVSTP